MKILSNNEVSLVSGTGPLALIAGVSTEVLVATIFFRASAMKPLSKLSIFSCFIGSALFADCAARIYEESQKQATLL